MVHMYLNLFIPYGHRIEIVNTRKNYFQNKLKFQLDFVIFPIFQLVFYYLYNDKAFSEIQHLFLITFLNFFVLLLLLSH